MGLCHTKQPIVDEDQNSAVGCLQRKSRTPRPGFYHGKEFRNPQKYVCRSMNASDVGWFSYSLKTTSLGSSMIRVPTIADGAHSCNPTFEAMLLGVTTH